MGINWKKFRNMTPEQRAKYRRNVIGLHRSLLLASSLGLAGVCLFAIGLLLFHLVKK